MQQSAWSVKYFLVVSSVLFLILLLSSWLAFPAWNTSTCGVQDVTLPKFQNSDVDPFCHLLADASATYIWSKLKLNNNNSNKLRPLVMKRYIQNSPSRAQIKSLATRIMSSPENTPLDILILLSRKQTDTKWTQRLQSLINEANIGGIKVKVHATVIDDENQEMREADILVDCRSSDEMEFLNTKFNDLTVLPEASNHLHVWKQSRIRSLLLTSKSKLVILVAEGPTNDHPLSSSVYSRTVQRLAHWYQLGYLLHNENLDQVIAFAILSWLVDYCSSPPVTDSKALLPGVQRLVEQSIRPPLDLATSWRDISQEWIKQSG